MIKKGTIYLFYFILSLQLAAQNQSLDYFIKAGLTNSPLLKDYKNQILSNVQDSLLVKAIKKPQVSATGQILVPPYGKKWGYDEAITNGGTYSAVVGVTQNIFLKNHTANAYENISLQNQSVANSTKVTERELKKLITDQYITAYAAYNEMLFRKGNTELVERRRNNFKTANR